jgi:hypothetical protein
MGLIGQPNISDNHFHSRTVHLDIIKALLPMMHKRIAL